MRAAADLFIFLLLSYEARPQYCGTTTCYCDPLGQGEFDYHLACPSVNNKTVDLEVCGHEKERIISYYLSPTCLEKVLKN